MSTETGTLLLLLLLLFTFVFLHVIQQTNTTRDVKYDRVGELKVQRGRLRSETVCSNEFTLNKFAGRTDVNRRSRK